MKNTLSGKTKEELCRYSPQSKREAVAELSGMARSGTFGKTGGKISLSIATVNRMLAGHISDLCEKAELTPPVITGSRRTLIVFDDAEKLLGIFGVTAAGGGFRYLECPPASHIKTDAEKRAFARGYFLVEGFLSTGRNRHLELSFFSEKLRDYHMNLVSDMDFGFKPGEREGRYTMYIKSKEKIADYLTYMGASAVSLDILAELVQGDVKKRTTAARNCDMANINRTVTYASSVSEAIKKIDEKYGLDSLDDKLQTTAYVRLAYMEDSLDELSKRLGVSKSCVKHRLDKLILLAEKI